MNDGLTLPLDAYPLPTLIVDQEGLVCAVNSACIELLQWPACDLVERCSWRVLRHGSVSANAQDWQSLLEASDDQHVAGIRDLWQRKDGVPLPLSLWARHHGEQVILSCSPLPVAADANGHGRMHAVLNAIPDAVVIADAASGLVVDVNGRACDVLGRSRASLIGSHQSSLHPAGEGAAEKFMAAVRDPENQGLSAINLLTADRQLVPTEVNAGLIDDGGQLQLIGIFRDLRERLSVQRALAESEERLRAFVAAAPFGIFIYELHVDTLLLRSINPAGERATGTPLGHLLGSTLGEAFPGLADSELEQRFCTIARVGGEAWWPRFAYDFGAIRGVFDVHAFQVGAGHMAVVFQEISERINLEDRLNSAEKLRALGQLSGGFAHDVNNLLAGIQGYAELLFARSDDDQTRTWAQSIISATGRAAALSQNLLAFARGQPHNPRPVEITAVIDDALAIFARSVPDTIRLEWQAPPPLWVSGDPAQLQSALLNLCLNASQAMAGVGVVQVEASPHRQESEGSGPRAEVCITIADRGSGLTAAARAHLFEPFFTTRGDVGGTGLGLASVFGTIRGHQGSVSIDDREGGGTVATVVLPCIEHSANADDAPLNRERCHVLVVDDEPTVRDMLVSMLDHLDCTVVAVDGGEAALAALGSGANFDWVLLDMVMPQMDGSATLARIREQWPGQRVVIVSGYSQQDQAEAVADMGVQGWLRKPFSLQVLARALGH